jgi:hypothetical protein
MGLTEYQLLNEAARRQLREVFGVDPVRPPDGIYPMTIDGRPEDVIFVGGNLQLLERMTPRAEAMQAEIERLRAALEERDGKTQSH